MEQLWARKVDGCSALGDLLSPSTEGVCDLDSIY